MTKEPKPAKVIVHIIGPVGCRRQDLKKRINSAMSEFGYELYLDETFPDQLVVIYAAEEPSDA